MDKILRHFATILALLWLLPASGQALLGTTPQLSGLYGIQVGKPLSLRTCPGSNGSPRPLNSGAGPCAHYQYKQSPDAGGMNVYAITYPEYEYPQYIYSKGITIGIWANNIARLTFPTAQSKNEELLTTLRNKFGPENRTELTEEYLSFPNPNKSRSKNTGTTMRGIKVYVWEGKGLRLELQERHEMTDQGRLMLYSIESTQASWDLVRKTNTSREARRPKL